MRPIEPPEGIDPHRDGSFSSESLKIPRYSFLGNKTWKIHESCVNSVLTEVERNMQIVYSAPSRKSHFVHQCRRPNLGRKSILYLSYEHLLKLLHRQVKRRKAEKRGYPSILREVLDAHFRQRQVPSLMEPQVTSALLFVSLPTFCSRSYSKTPRS